MAKGIMMMSVSRRLKVLLVTLVGLSKLATGEEEIPVYISSYRRLATW